MNREEQDRYAGSLKVYRDLKGVVDYAYGEGLETGIGQGLEHGALTKQREIARKLKLRGMPVPEIADLTGLNEADIDGR
jgi:hypothetical protein